MDHVCSAGDKERLLFEMTRYFALLSIPFVDRESSRKSYEIKQKRENGGGNLHNKYVECLDFQPFTVDLRMFVDRSWIYYI
jgi:hypothetical protein